jgi:hypothetical protein
VAAHILYTKRLNITALNKEELSAYISNPELAGSLLKLSIVPPLPVKRTREIVKASILPAFDTPDAHILFHTVWLGIDNKLNQIIGSFIFKGIENGSSEIGYGTEVAHRNKGYMSEMVAAATQWALEQPEIQTIKAITSPDNIASHKVLMHAGFVKTKHEATDIYWVKSTN